MKREVTYEKVLLRLAGLCASSEQCTLDIRSKALKAGLSVMDAERVVEYLVRGKYVDDRRFARAYASDKVRFSRWGRMKVRMGLRGKGIPDAVIAEALQSVDATEYSEALHKALESRVKNIDLTDIKERRSLYRHLASRGFESSMIIQAIKAYINSLKGE